MVAWSVTETVVTAATVVIALALVLGRRLSVKFGQIEGTVNAVHDAINGRDKGDPSISDDVKAIRATVETAGVRLANVENEVRTLARRVGALEQKVGDAA